MRPCGKQVPIYRIEVAMAGWVGMTLCGFRDIVLEYVKTESYWQC